LPTGERERERKLEREKIKNMKVATEEKIEKMKEKEVTDCLEEETYYGIGKETCYHTEHENLMQQFSCLIDMK
jgi:hypothetical protein